MSGHQYTDPRREVEPYPYGRTFEVRECLHCGVKHAAEPDSDFAGTWQWEYLWSSYSEPPCPGYRIQDDEALVEVVRTLMADGQGWEEALELAQAVLA